jgi:hypothetical protein
MQPATRETLMPEQLPAELAAARAHIQRAIQNTQQAMSVATDTPEFSADVTESINEIQRYLIHAAHGIDRLKAVRVK